MSPPFAGHSQTLKQLKTANPSGLSALLQGRSTHGARAQTVPRGQAAFEASGGLSADLLRVIRPQISSLPDARMRRAFLNNRKWS